MENGWESKHQDDVEDDSRAALDAEIAGVLEGQELEFVVADHDHHPHARVLQHESYEVVGTAESLAERPPPKRQKDRIRCLTHDPDTQTSDEEPKEVEGFSLRVPRLARDEERHVHEVDDGRDEG